MKTGGLIHYVLYFTGLNNLLEESPLKIQNITKLCNGKDISTSPYLPLAF